MLALSQAPYNIMMPDNYFCVMKDKVSKSTKLYVYNANLELEDNPEETTFPPLIGRFKRYDEGNPLVVPAVGDKPEKALDPREEDGKVQLPIASNSEFGLVRIDTDTLDINAATGKLSAHGLYRTNHLVGEGTGQAPYKNKNTIYYLTEDDGTYDGGLYAYDDVNDIYVSIGGKPFDNNTIILSEGEMAVNPVAPLYKGTNSDPGLHIKIDDETLKVEDEALGVKLDPESNIIKGVDGLGLKTDPESLDDSEGGLGVKLDPDGVIEKTADGLGLKTDDDTLKNDGGELTVKLSSEGALAAGVSGIYIVTNDNTIRSSEGQLNAVDIMSGAIQVVGANGSGVAAINTLNDSKIKEVHDALYLTSNSEGTKDLNLLTDNKAYADGAALPSNVPASFNGTVRVIPLDSEDALEAYDIHSTDITVQVPGVTAGTFEVTNSGVEAINKLNERLGAVHQWPDSMGDAEFRATNVADAVDALWHRVVSNELTVSEGLRLTSEGSGLKLDVLYDHDTVVLNNNNELHAVDFQNSEIRVRDHANGRIDSALKAINMLNSEIGDAHDLQQIFGPKGATNSEDIVGILAWLADRPSLEYHGSEGIETYQIDDTTGIVNVLYDGKLNAGALNTRDATITLTKPGDYPGPNKLRAVDFQNSEIRVFTREGDPVTSALQAINILGAEIGIDTSERRDTSEASKPVKEVIYEINSELIYITNQINNITAADPVEIGDKGAYWANQTAANTNTLYLTPSEGVLKVLHAYDYPVKDVKLTYNNNNTGSASNITIIENKDAATNGNQANVKLAQPTIKLNANNEVDLKLDPLKTIVTDRNGPDAASAGTGTYGLRVNIAASEGLVYTYGNAANTTPVSLKVDLDNTKNLLGFNNGKLDIPWINAKPTVIDEDKVLTIDSQGNAVWEPLDIKYEYLSDKPKINGVVLPATSEGGYGIKGEDLFLQRLLRPEDNSIVLTSDGNYQRIRANYAATGGITMADAPITVNGPTEFTTTRNVRGNDGLQNNAYTYTVKFDVISINPTTSKLRALVTTSLKSNNGYAFYNSTVTAVAAGITGTIDTLPANQSATFFSQAVDLTYTTVNPTTISVTVPYTFTSVATNPYAPQAANGLFTQNVTVKGLGENRIAFAHDKVYDNLKTMGDPGFYKISTDTYGHVRATGETLEGRYGVQVDDYRLDVLYDDLLTYLNHPETLYMIQSEGQYYLSVKDVRLLTKADLSLEEIIPNEITIILDSEQNTLADMFTVNDKIVAALGTYRGAYDSVEPNSEGTGLKDAYPIGTTGPSHIIANNDYANVLYTEITSEGSQQ